MGYKGLINILNALLDADANRKRVKSDTDILNTPKIANRETIKAANELIKLEFQVF